MYYYELIGNWLVLLSDDGNIVITSKLSTAFQNSLFLSSDILLSDFPFYFHPNDIYFLYQFFLWLYQLIKSWATKPIGIIKPITVNSGVRLKIHCRYKMGSKTGLILGIVYDFNITYARIYLYLITQPSYEFFPYLKKFVVVIVHAS